MPIQARWLIPEGNPQAAQALAVALRIGLPAARVLLARELGDPEAARRFLAPSLADLHAPAALRGMTEAVARLKRAISGGERILIYGDYDVDGTTSVVILKKAIEMAGGTASFIRSTPAAAMGTGCAPKRWKRPPPRGHSDDQRGYRHPRG